MVRAQVTYLDTHIVAALNRADVGALSARARRTIEKEVDLRVSPMVLVELEFLRELQRIRVPAAQILGYLASEIGLRICDAPFADVAMQAAQEGWTRDPFDRIIVAQARMAGAVLITRDQHIHARYSRALE